MAMNWSNVTPNHLIVPIKCYDLTTGLLAGSFDMALHTEYSSLSPLWCTSTALSPTEIIESDNEKHISFHGDTLMIMEDKTLNVAAVHLPSLLEDWPEEYDEDNYTTLPTCSLGTTEGKRKLVCHQSGTFSVSSYNTATLESLDQHNGTATDSIPFSVAYLNEDRCFVLPVTIGGPGKGSYSHPT
ncbi:SubName: Full=Uncharacterized protein {ECO:0000313/EMBL:CCA71300.1} [Serendipita indica DSM 11827]|nr:SubName: Full=Uncharacterized protein {ECO:0000313/EMBL:CCA71300.1} [Serendipita indica DSM 11827]